MNLTPKEPNQTIIKPQTTPPEINDLREPINYQLQRNVIYYPSIKWILWIFSKETCHLLLLHLLNSSFYSHNLHLLLKDFTATLLRDRLLKRQPQNKKLTF